MMVSKKILVMGLPGAGKTTLSRLLAKRLVAVHFNADEIRANINKDLGFSLEDRIEQARRMGWLCDQVVKSNSYAIADFICPTPETRAAFGPAFVIWLDRIQRSAYDDTNALFVPPERYDVRVTAEGMPEYWANKIADMVRPAFDPKQPTALFVGRWQPFHDGHKALIEEGLARVGQVCIGVRDTHGIDNNNPLSFAAVKERIEAALFAHVGRVLVIPLPNITNFLYGRDVGYGVERISFDQDIESISGTELRKRIGLR
jgi:adenylylsulfate kinase